MHSLILSYKQIRQAIGALGISLPALIYLHTGVVRNCWQLQDSISHYFYTTGIVFFEGILWILGLVLFFYPGHKSDKEIDTILTKLSGVFAWGVALIPTNNMEVSDCAVFTYPHSLARNVIHYICAGSMLAIFSYMSIWLFRRTDQSRYSETNPIRWKKIRNGIYLACGILTALSIITIGVLAFLESKKVIHLSFKYTFWFEVTAIVPFGVAWLVKGGFIFTDQDEVSTIRSLLRVNSAKS